MLRYGRERFQLWGYIVSMSQLLLRSTKSERFDTRVDIAFWNVQAIQLPTLLPGMRVAPADSDEVERIKAEAGLGATENTPVFLVVGRGYRGYVVAGGMVTCEDSGEYFAPSLIWDNRPQRHI